MTASISIFEVSALVFSSDRTITTKGPSGGWLHVMVSTKGSDKRSAVAFYTPDPALADRFADIVRVLSGVLVDPGDGGADSEDDNE